MPLNKKKLERRALTAGIGTVVVACFIVVLPKWCFHLFLFVAGIIGVHEFKRVAHNFGYHFHIVPLLVTLLYGFGTLYIDFLDINLLPYLAVAASVLNAMVPPTKMEETLPDAGIALTGCAYLGLSLISCAYIINLSGPLNSGLDQGRLLVAFCILMVWAGDSSAYIFGSMFGKHKIAPTVSPNKTYEGTAANLLGNFLFAWLAKETYLTELQWFDVVFLSVIFGVFGFFGDLVESSWKRGSGIKDSGSFLPGHGGILDRLDSIFLTAPVLYWYLTTFVLTVD